MRPTSALAFVALVATLFVFSGVAAAQPKSYGAHLSGRNEVPPADTTAQGNVRFRLAADASTLDFRLVVANIDNVVAAHIHCAEEGMNGPVGVLLFAGGPVTTNGILAEGSITAPGAGNSCQWETLGDVIDAIESGAAYVNVHTTAHPGGEIRGQVK